VGRGVVGGQAEHVNEGLMVNPPELTSEQRSPRRVKPFVVGGIGLVAFIVAAILIVRAIIGGAGSPANASRDRIAIDAVSGKVFDHYTVEEGKSFPWKNPKTGKNTLYPVEKCYWTAEGKAKINPTYVLLNEYAGKDGPTICPDCGRVVVPHNPMPPAELMVEALDRDK